MWIEANNELSSYSSLSLLFLLNFFLSNHSFFFNGVSSCSKGPTDTSRRIRFTVVHNYYLSIVLEMITWSTQTSPTFIFKEYDLKLLRWPPYILFVMQHTSSNEITYCKCITFRFKANNHTRNWITGLVTWVPWLYLNRENTDLCVYKWSKY